MEQPTQPPDAAPRAHRGRGLPRVGRLSSAPRIGKPSIESMVGLPPRLQRLKAIEVETAQHLVRLQRAHEALAERCGDDADLLDRLWRERVGRWRFDAVNALIDEHNEWYPVEARLRWDIAAEDYRDLFNLPWRRQHLDAAWALAQVPGLPS